MQNAPSILERGKKKKIDFLFFAQEGTVKQQPLWLSPLPWAHQGLTLAHKDVRSSWQLLHASARERFVIIYSLLGVELVAAWSCLSLALVIQATDRQMHLVLSGCIAHAGPVSLVKGNERVPLK